MKKQIVLTALLGLAVVTSPAFAGVTYGPVITVKPKGYQSEPKQESAKPAAPNKVDNTRKPKPGLLLPAIQKQKASTKPASPKNVNNGQKPQKTGLLLPAIQKARSSSTETGGKKSDGETGTPIQGGLDRDIIRRTVPSQPKPKPNQ